MSDDTDSGGAGASDTGVWSVTPPRAREKMIVFAVAAIAYAAFVLTSPRFTFYFDAKNYWLLAESFFSSGRFSLTNFDSPLRGYTFPLFLALLSATAKIFGFSAVILFKIVSALLLAAFVSFVAPLLAWRAFGVALRWPGLVVFHLLVFFFWRGYLEYPLTDFPSVYLLAVALIFALSISPRSSLFLGLTLALLTNLRPAYELVWLTILPLTFLYQRRNGRSFPQAIRSLALVIAGALVAFAPQVAINRAHFHTMSPLVQAKLSGEKDLFLQQLYWGVSIQKWETSLGGDYPRAGVIHNDPAGHRLKTSGSFQPPMSYGRYARDVLRHPLASIAIYARHIFNAFDVKYPTPYVGSVYGLNPLLSLVNYAVLFTGLAGLIALLMTNRSAIVMLAVASVLAPAVVAIPTAIETRFFLPVTLLFYGIAAVVLCTREIVSRALRPAIAIAFIAFVSICFLMSKATLASIDMGAATLIGRHERPVYVATDAKGISSISMHREHDALVGSIRGTGFDRGDVVLLDGTLTYPAAYGGDVLTFSIPTWQVAPAKMHSVQVANPDTRTASPPAGVYLPLAKRGYFRFSATNSS